MLKEAKSFIDTMYRELNYDDQSISKELEKLKCH